MTTTTAPTTEPAKLLLSLPEAAALLSIGETLMRGLLDEGEIRTVKIGARRLIRRADLEAFVARLDADLDPS